MKPEPCRAARQMKKAVSGMVYFSLLNREGGLSIRWSRDFWVLGFLGSQRVDVLATTRCCFS